MKKTKIILIDDDESFLDHFSFYAEISDWCVSVIQNFNEKQLKALLNEHQPDWVLIDHNIGTKKNFIDAVSIIKDFGLIDNTILISGNEKIEGISDFHGITYFKKKPFEIEDVDRIINEKEVPVRSDILKYKHEINDSLLKWFENLEPAVTIHDTYNLKRILLSNKAARNSCLKGGGLKGLEYRILNMMSEELKENGNKKSVRRHDWSVDDEMWVYSRLYNVKGGYWFSRIKYKSDNLLYDIGSQGKSEYNTLNEFVDRVHENFKLWGVTRIRLYSVDSFYDDVDLKKGYNLVPITQRGGGFFCDSDEHWRSRYFTYFENENLKESLYMPKGSIYHLGKVSDENNKLGCEIIQWGNPRKGGAGTKAEIPLREFRIDKGERHWGLLSIDQRIDHLKDPKWVKNFSVAGTSLSGFPPLTEDEMGQMSGFLKQIIPVFCRRLREFRREKRSLWHELVSRNIDEVLGEASISAVKTFETILMRLSLRWHEVASPIPGDDIKEIKNDCGATISHNLVNWYFLKEEEGEQFRVLAGIGELANDRKNKFYKKVKPFSLIFENDKPNECFNIQKFQEWRNGDGEKDVDSYVNNERRRGMVDEIGSLFGYCFNLNGESYLMIVHSSTESYFTTYRTRLLRDACKQLSSVLLWVVAEESRIWFNRALTHELNTPLSLADNLANSDIDDKEKKLQYVTQMLSSMVDNVRRLNDNDLGRNVEFNECKVSTTLKDAFSGVQFLIDWYEEVGISLDFNTDLNDKERIMEVDLDVSYQALKEVLFNILHNAYKYCYFMEDKVSVSFFCEAGNLKVLVRNRSAYKLSAENKDRIFLPYFRAKNSGNESGAGLGLAVVKKLCETNGMKCQALDTECLGENEYYQSFIIEIKLCRDNY